MITYFKSSTYLQSLHSIYGPLYLLRFGIVVDVKEKKDGWKNLEKNAVKS